MIFPERQAKSPYSFFILRGFPRSGTNWLSNLLNLHPEIFVNGEFAFSYLDIRAVTDNWRSILSSEEYKDKTIAHYHEFVRNVLMIGVDLKPTARVLGDRTPQPLESFLPGAKALWVHRDPRDVIVSWTYHRFNMINKGNLDDFPGFEYLGDQFEKYSKDVRYFQSRPQELLSSRGWLETFCERWTRHQETSFKFTETHPDVYRVSYESL
ncbi:unnamed protein product, partial [marine sediment metagenome]